MENVKAIVQKMTLEEKAAMCSGSDFWHTQGLARLGIPKTMLCDGPHGLRKQPDECNGDHLGLNGAIEAVCFPTACATACSFDREMLEEMGKVLGNECRAEDVSVLLGPAVNIKRSPLCGRNFEYLSEDPFVAGELAAAYIKGVQSQKVGTSIKHFAANNQETARMTVSSQVDERTLREIYFPAFETAVKKARPWTVMCSYNRINGTYASEDPWLLTEVLRREWGFDGYVVSDWGASRDRVRGIQAGMDLEMPGSNGVNDQAIIQAVKDGTLKEEQLDQTVERILNVVLRYEAGKAKGAVFDREADHEKAVEFAGRSMVLLKNEGVLPLKKEEKIAMIGGFGANPRYQGGGSSHINSYKAESAWSLADRYGCITYAEGFPADGDQMDGEMALEAVNTARLADKIVVFAGLPEAYESEGYDRTHMRLPECQNQLIRELLTLKKPVIVVLHNGSPVELPWAEEVQGILEAYLCGEGTGRAEMDILYGRINPSGKLAETFPKRLEDNPSYLSFGGKGKQAPYSEGIFAGYRYYDTRDMEVLFPFGYGLSYTHFSYSGLRVGMEDETGRKGIRVYVDVTNTGTVEGREIVQLYVSDHTGAAIRPKQELKGFTSVNLKPGETKTVELHLDERAFSWYDPDSHQWRADNGRYELRIGASSRDIRLKTELVLSGAPEPCPVIDENVMLGDLLDCRKTRAYVKEHLLRYLDPFTGGKPLEECGELEWNLVYYMPLSSLRSFSGVGNEEIGRVVEELRGRVIQEDPEGMD